MDRLARTTATEIDPQAFDLEQSRDAAESETRDEPKIIGLVRSPRRPSVMSAVVASPLDGTTQYITLTSRLVSKIANPMLAAMGELVL